MFSSSGGRVRANGKLAGSTETLLLLPAPLILDGAADVASILEKEFVYRTGAGVLSFKAHTIPQY